MEGSDQEAPEHLLEFSKNSSVTTLYSLLHHARILWDEFSCLPLLPPQNVHAQLGHKNKAENSFSELQA